MPNVSDPRQNHILAALPADGYAALLPHLELVSMPLGHVLHESGARMQHLYFPTTCIISRLYVMEDGSSAETDIVGYEGVIGVALYMGGETTPARAIVQSAGHAYVWM